MLHDKEVQSGRGVVFRYGPRRYWAGEIGSPRYIRSRERIRLAETVEHRGYVDVYEVVAIVGDVSAARTLAAELAEIHRQCDEEARKRRDAAIHAHLTKFQDSNRG